jgi:hypothetical protein
MSNSLTKILPFDASETPAIEAWLNDLAASRGLIHVRYQGPKDLRDCISLFEAHLGIV